MDLRGGPPPTGVARGARRPLAGQIAVKKSFTLFQIITVLRPPRGVLRGGGRSSQMGVWGHQPPSVISFIFSIAIRSLEKIFNRPVFCAEKVSIAIRFIARIAHVIKWKKGVKYSLSWSSTYPVIKRVLHTFFHNKPDRGRGVGPVNPATGYFFRAPFRFFFPASTSARIASATNFATISGASIASTITNREGSLRAYVR